MRVDGSSTVSRVAVAWSVEGRGCHRRAPRGMSAYPGLRHRRPNCPAGRGRADQRCEHRDTHLRLPWTPTACDNANFGKWLSFRTARGTDVACGPSAPKWKRLAFHGRARETHSSGDIWRIRVDLFPRPFEQRTIMLQSSKWKRNGRLQR